MALLLALAIPTVIYADDAPANPGMPPPPPPRGTTTIHSALQEQYQTGMANLQNNRDYRNNVMEGRYASGSPMMASGTPPYRSMPDGLAIPPLMRRFASSTALGSSTLIQRITADHQHQQGIRADAFAFLQNNLIQQLDQALANLQEIRGRVASRIQTETAQGVDMTKATAILATADKDITAAQAAIQALAAYAPSTTGLTASTTVDLSRGRQLGATAIGSTESVRKDLTQAVQAIADAMGVPPAGTSTLPSNAN